MASRKLDLVDIAVLKATLGITRIVFGDRHAQRCLLAIVSVVAAGEISDQDGRSRGD